MRWLPGNLATLTMKTFLALGIAFCWPLLAWCNYPDRWVDLHWTSPVTNRYVTFCAEPHGKPPDDMAYLTEPENPDTNFIAAWVTEGITNRHLIPKDRGTGLETFDDHANAVWVPFQTNVSVDLGPGDGARWLWICFRNKEDSKPKWIGKFYLPNGSGDHWDAHHIVLQTAPPTVVFTDPKERVTAQPMIQLKGYVTTDLQHPLEYQVFDQNGAPKAGGEGSVNDRYFDMVIKDFTTNFFTCYDIDLTQGTNTIVLSGTDSAGFSFKTNFVCVFTTVGHTNPPRFSVDWPGPGQEVPGESFTIRGPSDDPTAKMVGQISAHGHTNFISALIERNGFFWYENVPLAEGTNDITLTATDVAGNTSTTNFSIIGLKDTILTMDPVRPADQLWQPKIDVVTGKVQPADQAVWINGVQATVKADGTWLAKNVPVQSSPSGGTALFDLTSVPPGDLAKGNSKPNEQLSSQASLGTNAMVLNASSPACGVFKLHLTEVAERTFVIEASTNLTEWIPILTNSSASGTFDFLDTNTNHYPCRFFRVVPVP
jgi:hypothetical protein